LLTAGPERGRLGAWRGPPDAFLGMLAAADAAALRQRGVARRHRPGDTLSTRTTTIRVLLVLAGRVRVTHTAPDGRETILASCSAGAWGPPGGRGAEGGAPVGIVHATLCPCQSANTATVTLPA
jgi:hypothetical protein